MRTKIVAGNWKMNKNYHEGIQLINEINNGLKKSDVFVAISNIEVVLSPSFILLPKCCEMIKGHGDIFAASQNCYTKNDGAFTGEISASMIKSAGATYVIIGHSERRMLFKETNEMLAEKVDAVLANNLKPIFCCGELLEERDRGKHFKVIEEQLEQSVFHLDDELFRKIVIAYEPVWAIGTGATASSTQAQEIHAYIRGLIERKYSVEIAQQTSILYGGSCKPSNAKELFENEDVDGGLIGGASLNADDFIGIINAFIK